MYKFILMNHFLIQADIEKNILRIILDGFFVKSEIELAFYLLRIEKRKLVPGYDAFVDIDNLRYVNTEVNITKSKMKKILKLSGAGKIQFAHGIHAIIGSDQIIDGFYPN